MQGTLKQNRDREILVQRGQEVPASPCVALPLPPHAPEVQACIECEEPWQKAICGHLQVYSLRLLQMPLSQGIPMTFIRVMFTGQLSRGATKQIYGD